jgi:hypothetical protein
VGGDPTHQEQKHPQVSVRFLADYMAASAQKRRTIIRTCKYQTIARLIQHSEARSAIAGFYASKPDVAALAEKAQKIRDRLETKDFDRSQNEHNADYIDNFLKVQDKITMPSVEILSAGPSSSLMMNGVKVNTEIRLRFKRLTSTNKIKLGAASFRYAKGKALAPEVAAWQSAFLLGYLKQVTDEDEAEAEGKLCLTIDCFGGVMHSAPTNSVSRFQNMMAECESIAERWPNIKPPPGAILK